jgi:hypothetical protein
MIEALATWRPSTWVDYAILYTVPGASMDIYLLAKILLERPSDFARSLARIMGKEETWLDMLKEIFALSFGMICVLIGWPGFLVWLIKDKIDDAARQKRDDEPDFNCLPEYLISKVNPVDAEIASYVVEPLGTVPPLPFGHLNKGWVNFLSDMVDDRDEMWSFNIPKGSKHGKYRIAATSEVKGYARVRNGKVLAEFITESD